MSVPILNELYHPQIKIQTSVSIEWIFNQCQWNSHIRGWGCSDESRSTGPALLEPTAPAWKCRLLNSEQATESFLHILRLQRGNMFPRILSRRNLTSWFELVFSCLCPWKQLQQFSANVQLGAASNLSESLSQHPLFILTPGSPHWFWEGPWFGSCLTTRQISLWSYKVKHDTCVWGKWRCALRRNIAFWSRQESIHNLL